MTYWFNDGFVDILEKNYKVKDFQKAFEFDAYPAYGNWIIHIMISVISFYFFQGNLKWLYLKTKMRKTSNKPFGF